MAFFAVGLVTKLQRWSTPARWPSAPVPKSKGSPTIGFLKTPTHVTSGWWPAGGLTK